MTEMTEHDDRSNGDDRHGRDRCGDRWEEQSDGDTAVRISENGTSHED